MREIFSNMEPMLFEEPLKCKSVAAGQLRGATLTRAVPHGGRRDKIHGAVVELSGGFRY